MLLDFENNVYPTRSSSQTTIQLQPHVDNPTLPGEPRFLGPNDENSPVGELGG